MSFLDAEGVELVDSMLGQSGSCVWKVRAGKGGKYRLARNLTKTQRFELDRKTRKLPTCGKPFSFYFFTWRYNGSITFLHLAFSPVFRILHKNGFEPIRQKTRFFPSKKPESAQKSPIPGLKMKVGQPCTHLCVSELSCNGTTPLHATTPEVKIHHRWIAKGSSTWDP